MSDPRVKAFGLAATHARESAGLSQRQATQKLGWAQGKLSRIENAERSTLTNRQDIEQLDALYGQDGNLLRVAGYRNGMPDNGDEVLRSIIEHHITQLLEDVRKLLDD